jgi:hypothetical protein
MAAVTIKLIMQCRHFFTEHYQFTVKYVLFEATQTFNNSKILQGRNICEIK